MLSVTLKSLLVLDPLYNNIHFYNSILYSLKAKCLPLGKTTGISRMWVDNIQHPESTEKLLWQHVRLEVQCVPCF